MGAGAVVRPVGARFFVATVEAAHGQHHHGGREAHFGTRALIHCNCAGHLAGAVLQCEDAVAMQQGEAADFRGFAQRGNHAPRQFARGSPDDVVARNAVAVAVHAAFHPIHSGHELHTCRQQPVVHLAARMLHIVLGPLARQHVALAQFGKAQPVGQRPLGRVGDLHARLERRAHQCHATKGPQGQAAEALGRVAVHQSDGSARAQAFQRGDDTGQAPADHHHIVRL